MNSGRVGKAAQCHSFSQAGTQLTAAPQHRDTGHRADSRGLCRREGVTSHCHISTWARPLSSSFAKSWQIWYRDRLPIRMEKLMCTRKLLSFLKACCELGMPYFFHTEEGARWRKVVGTGETNLYLENSVTFCIGRLFRKETQTVKFYFRQWVESWAECKIEL